MWTKIKGKLKTALVTLGIVSGAIVADQSIDPVTGVGTAFPAGHSRTTAVVYTRRMKKQIRQDVVQDRTFYRKTVTDGDGVEHTAWMPPDTNIITVPEATWPYQMKKAVWEFGAKDDGTIAVRHHGSVFKQKLAACAWINPGQNDFGVIRLAQEVTPTVENNVIAWDNIIPGMGMAAICLPDRFKEIVVVSQPVRDWLQANAPPNPDEVYFGLVYEVMWDELGNYEIATTEKETIEEEVVYSELTHSTTDAYDATDLRFKKGGRVKHVLAPSTAVAGDVEVNMPRRLFVKNGKNYLVDAIRLDKFLAMPEGTVTIDPSVIFQEGVGGYTGCIDAYIIAGSPDINYGSTLSSTIGNAAASNRRFVISFDYENITDVDVSDAQLGIYCESESSADDDSFYVYPILLDWGGGTVTWNSAVHGILAWNTAGCAAASDVTGQDSTADRKATATDSVAITGAGAFFNMDVTSDIQRVLTGGLNNNNYGYFIINPAGEANGRGKVTMTANHATTAKRPKLTTTYTLGARKKRNPITFNYADATTTWNEYRIRPNRTKVYADGETKNRAVLYEEAGVGQITESSTEFTMSQASTAPAYFRSFPARAVGIPYKFIMTFDDVFVGSSFGAPLFLCSADWNGQPTALMATLVKFAIFFYPDHSIHVRSLTTEQLWRYWDDAAWQEGATAITGVWADSTEYTVEIESDGTTYTIGVKDAAGSYLAGAVATRDIDDTNDPILGDFISFGNFSTTVNQEFSCDVTAIDIPKHYNDAAVDKYMTVDLLNDGTATRSDGVDGSLILRMPDTTDGALVSSPEFIDGKKYYATAEISMDANNSRWGMIIVSSDWDSVPDGGADGDADSKISISFGSSAGHTKLVYWDASNADWFWDGSVWQANSTNWYGFSVDTVYYPWIKRTRNTYTFGVKNVAGAELGTPAIISEASCRDTGKNDIIYLGTTDADAGTGIMTVDDIYWYLSGGGFMSTWSGMW